MTNSGLSALSEVIDIRGNWLWIVASLQPASREQSRVGAVMTDRSALLT